MSHVIFNMLKKMVLNVLIKNEKSNIFGTGGKRVKALSKTVVVLNRFYYQVIVKSQL